MGMVMVMVRVRVRVRVRGRVIFRDGVGVRFGVECFAQPQPILGLAFVLRLEQ